MARLRSSLILGGLIGLLGLVLSLSDPAREIEASLGLGTLFNLRGVRTPPANVVVISIDQASSEALAVSSHPDKWPRSLHAQLVDTLRRRGARIVVFDMYFSEPSTLTEDAAFAAAMRKSRNVILAVPLQVRQLAVDAAANATTTEHRIVERVEPTAILSDAAVAVAPFVLPGMPVQMHRYWTFQPGAGDAPTFPVVAFQLYASRGYEELLQLLQRAETTQSQALPHDIAAAVDAHAVVSMVRDLHELFTSDPDLAYALRTALLPLPLEGGDRDRRLLASLLEMYSGPAHRYLNFYGPAHTIPTVSFAQALGESGDSVVDFHDKAVFVGVSPLTNTEREDRYYTAFSRATGVFVSGVEIAATAFANLFEGRPVQPISATRYLLLVLAWGVFLGGLCCSAGNVVAALGVVAASLAYLLAAEHAFRATDTWYPLVVPLLVQAPFAFFGSLLWRYFEVNRERQNVRNALAHYVPDEVVKLLARDRIDALHGGQTVYGVCLFSDIENYTSLSERISPGQLGELMRRYFGAVFAPIKESGGLIVALEGDAILAVWKGARPEVLHLQACRAALGITRAVRLFNQQAQGLDLPTRVGMHAGQLFLGNIGGGGYYAYSAAGDTVNTASRLEGLNKHLGTAILVSDAVVGDLDGFLTRVAGAFLLKGKTQPVVVHELLGRIDEATPQQRRACAIFGEATQAFRARAWDEAHTLFVRTQESASAAEPTTTRGDALASFYLRLCAHYRGNPPPPEWDGVIALDQK